MLICAKCCYEKDINQFEMTVNGKIKKTCSVCLEKQRNRYVIRKDENSGDKNLLKYLIEKNDEHNIEMLKMKNDIEELIELVKRLVK